MLMFFFFPRFQNVVNSKNLMSLSSFSFLGIDEITRSDQISEREFTAIEQANEVNICSEKLKKDCC